MPNQLIGHTCESSAFVEPKRGIKYWVDTKSAGVQVLQRKAPRDWMGREVLRAPVVVLVGHRGQSVEARYLDDRSTEHEIEDFTRRYVLDHNQRMWCFAALERIAPVVVEEGQAP